MSSHFTREIVDSQARVFAEASDDCANPGRIGAFGLATCAFHELLHGCAQAPFIGFLRAHARQGARLRAGSSAHPSRDRNAWKPLAPERGSNSISICSNPVDATVF